MSVKDNKKQKTFFATCNGLVKDIGKTNNIPYQILQGLKEKRVKKEEVKDFKSLVKTLCKTIQQNSDSLEDNQSKNLFLISAYLLDSPAIRKKK